MKKVFLMVCVAGASLFASAQDGTANPVDPNAPEIKWESTDIDYGTINQDAEGGREFKFTNVGKSPLVISNCRGSCGCTVPTCPTQPVMPGQKGTIQVKYDTHRIGAFTKTVTVESNAKSSTETLKIHGNILDPNAAAGAGATPTPEVKPTPAPTPAAAAKDGKKPTPAPTPAKSTTTKKGN
jgi:hypothetical protein